MQQGFYRLEHSYLSRAGNKLRGPSKRGHLGAATNYYANTNKVSATLAVNLPTNRRELMSEMWAHDNRITRANGRVAETLIISFDKRMSLEHRKEAAQSFLQEVTLGGQTKAVAFLHDNDQINLHAHVVVLDVGADGKPVSHFGRSGTFRREHSPVKGNPTEWLRKKWEDSQNLTLEQHDYPFRVDRRSREAQQELDGAARETNAAEVQEAEISNDNDPQSPELPVEADQQDVPTSETEDEMVISREGKHPSYVYVRDAIEYDVERRCLHHVQAQVRHHEDAKARAEKEAVEQAERAREFRQEALAAERALHSTSEALAGYTKSNGKLRGWAIKWGPIDWKNQTRVIGETLTKEKVHYVSDHLVKLKATAETEYAAGVAENEARENALSMAAHQRELNGLVATYGDRATLESADKLLDASVHAALAKVELKEIYADFENGDLTGQEAIHAFELLGEHAMVMAVRQRMGIEEEQEVANDNDLSL